jgi:hypothetical protein
MCILPCSSEYDRRNQGVRYRTLTTYDINPTRSCRICWFSSSDSTRFNGRNPRPGPSKNSASVRSEHFYVAFFLMSLNDNREPRLSFKNGRYGYSVFSFLVCLDSLFVFTFTLNSVSDSFFLFLSICVSIIYIKVLIYPFSICHF